MPEWIIALHGVTFLWLLGWAVRATLDVNSTSRRSVSFLLLTFFVFYGIPIALDLTNGIPEYRSTPGFASAAAAPAVAIIYDLFVMACPMFWWLTAPSRRVVGGHVTVFAGKKAQRVLWLLLCSPIIALVFAPQPAAYLSYGAVLRDTMSPEAWEFHGIISGLTLISVVGGASLLLVRRNFGRAIWLVLPFMTIAMWLQGKRAIVALCFVLVWAVVWFRGLMTRPKVILFGTLSVIALGGYIAWYQLEFRPVSVADSYSVYENSRIEYGRDQELKSAIYCELSDGGVRILDYRGESVLFSLAMYVPRSLWPGKPWPYAVYVTAYALQNLPVDRGWGLTTSVLDESVANIGWAGLLIGPLVLALLCRMCDRSPDPVVKVVGSLVACLLITVQLAAFAPLVIAWLLYVRWSRRVLGARRRLGVAREVSELVRAW